MPRVTPTVTRLALTLALGAAGARAQTTITWMVESGWNQTPVKAAASAFEKANPDVRVVLQPIPFEQLFAQTQARLSAKSPTPDVVSVDAPLIAAYGLQNFLLPLDGAYTKAELGEFLPASLSTSSFRGKLLAPPMWNSTQVLYYNKDLLGKAKVPFPSPDPKARLTWEQVVSAAQKAMVRQGGRVTAWGLAIEQADRPYQLLPLALSAGGQSLGKDGLQASGVVNSPAWVRAFTFYGDLYNKYGVSPKSATVASAVDLFASGQTAFFWGGPWNMARFRDTQGLNWGFAPTPYFAGGKPVTPNDSWHLGVNRASQNPEVATRFVKFMTLGPGLGIMNVAANGDAPTLKRTAQQIQTDAAFAKFPMNLQRLVAYEVANTAVPRPSTPGFTEYQDILTAAFGDIRTGTSAQTALDSAARQIDRALAKYRR